MHDTNQNGRDRPPSAASPTEPQKLRDAIAQLEQGVEQKRRAAKSAPRLEPVYMLVFLGFIIAGLGGMLAYQSRIQAGIRELGRPPSAFVDRLWYDAKAITYSFPVHIKDYWWLDLGVMALGVLAVVYPKEVSTRRRAFRLLAVLVVVTFGTLMVVELLNAQASVLMQ